MESQYPVKHKIPPSILSYCTMDKVDGTMESQYPVKHKIFGYMVRHVYDMHDHTDGTH